jgi:hypothetical protein
MQFEPIDQSTMINAVVSQEPLFGTMTPVCDPEGLCGMDTD